MNEVSPEGVPSYEGVEGRPMQITGQRVEAILNELKTTIPGVALEGMDVAEIEKAVFLATRRAAKAETKEQEAGLLRQADAWRSLLPFVRSDNSITGVNSDQTGRPIGLNVLIRELPKK
jgi:hypothetical protein